MEKRTCIICGEDISKLNVRAKICHNPECKKENERRCYQKRLKLHICVHCGKEFIGKDKERLCENCKNIYIKHKFTKKIVEHRCKHCGELLYTIEKNNTKPQTLIYDSVCDECKLKNRENFSIRMKLKNSNGYCKEYETLEDYEKDKQLKIEQEKKNKIENKRAWREKMRLNNPMSNPEIVKKCHETRQKRIKSGEIVYKRGKEHKRFKGGRSLMKAVRLKLIKWSRTILERDHFTCTLCGLTDGLLHVHHNERLTDIINKFCKTLQLSRTEIEYGSVECLKLIDEIVKYHNEHSEIGITLCEECHSKVDKYYHKKLNKNENISRKI